MQIDLGFVLWLTGGLCTVIGVIVVWAWKHTHALIKTKAEERAITTLAAMVKEKADDSRVTFVVDRVEKMFSNQREDNNHVFSEIAKVADSHSRFTEKMIEELGKRPTREECAWRGHITP